MKRIALAGLIVVVALASVWFLARSNKDHAASEQPDGKKRRVAFYRDPMHPSYTSDRPGKAPDCGMDLEPVYAGIGDTGAIAVSGGQREMMGLTVGRVERSRTSGSLKTIGRVALDENRVFPVRAGCDGVVTRIAPDVATGTRVRKGQWLASVYGRDYTTAQRSFLYALRASENPPPTIPGDDTSQPVLTLKEARLFLKTLGIGDEQVEQLEKTRQVTLDVALTAPASGVILARNVFPQQRFERDVELFRIADLSHVWVIAELVGDDQAAIGAGDRAEVFLPGHPRSDLRATVSDALGRFDGGSRSLNLRLETDNSHLILRPDMVVDLLFAISLPEATTVPSGAVVDSGTQKTVFVDRGDGTLEPRRVDTGWRFNGRVQIIGGLAPGEPIVVSGNALLDAETRIRRGDAGLHD